MKILSIDTSSKICSVAILEDKKAIFKKHINDEKSHSQNLMSLIKEAFDLSCLNLDDIDLFCVAKGPGSFTGIRIGIATIKGFIDIDSKDVIGITSLEGLVYNLYQNSQYTITSNDFVCSMIDAKNENVYYGLFQFKNDKFTLVGEYIADHIKKILELLKENQNQETKLFFIGDGCVIHKQQIQESFKNGIFVEEHLNNQNSLSNGICAYLKYKEGHIQKSEDLIPLYLRPSQAERMLKKKESNN